MPAFIVMLALGAIISVLGAVNMTGNISSLHSYHRHRVSEADIKPFGRLVGLGTIIIGVSVALFGTFILISEKLNSDTLVFIGTALLIAGIIAGLIISFYAMIKYNKGIF